MSTWAVIRAVTFDLDNTLYDFQACVNLGAARVVAALCERHPAAAALASVERFHQLWHEATEEARDPQAPIDWPRVRRRGIERLTLLCDCFEEALVDELTALYFHHRQTPIPPFEDAADAVARLALRLPLGIISNAGTELTQIGMAGQFRIVLNSTTTGYRKPDPRVFHQAAAALGCAPEEMLHVGDRMEDDVAGALEAGCHAAWYRRLPGASSGVSLSEWPPAAAGEASRSYLVVADHRPLADWVLERLAGTTEAG